MAQLIISEVLVRAIQREIESQSLYAELSRKVREPAAREAFNSLCQEEQQHQRFLEQYQRCEITDGALRGEQVIDYKIADYLERPELTPDMKLQEVFLLAADREKAAHDLYLVLAKVHPWGQVRRLLEGLAMQELKHKQKVEQLYTEVAFPQTDGG